MCQAASNKSMWHYSGKTEMRANVTVGWTLDDSHTWRSQKTKRFNEEASSLVLPEGWTHLSFHFECVVLSKFLINFNWKYAEKSLYTRDEAESLLWMPEIFWTSIKLKSVGEEHVFGCCIHSCSSWKLILINIQKQSRRLWARASLLSWPAWETVMWLIRSVWHICRDIINAGLY